VPKEEPTVPGEPPGVYGCDYQTLAQIAVLHAEARIALLNRDPKVRHTQPLLHHSHSCLIMLLHRMHGSPSHDALGLRIGNGSLRWPHIRGFTLAVWIFTAVGCGAADVLIIISASDDEELKCISPMLPALELTAVVHHTDGSGKIRGGEGD